ncbi:class I SAM-dependent methyltransferase [Streptomyces mirabilis]|uniref:class I SAM-dependent methyltransferase n=1 Tax=Streptomyces mirabilis TaxID=68239 RepID=UPI0031BA716B
MVTPRVRGASEAGLLPASHPCVERETPVSTPSPKILELSRRALPRGSCGQGPRMPFDHNDHYHRMLLRKLPKHGRVALDVGCGTGGFARRMAARGYEVDAVDPSAEVIAVARRIGVAPGSGGRTWPPPRCRRGTTTSSPVWRACTRPWGPAEQPVTLST